MSKKEEYNHILSDKYILEINLDLKNENEQWNSDPRNKKLKVLKIKSKILKKSLEFINSKKFYEKLNKEDYLFFISVKVEEQIPPIKLDLKTLQEHISLERCLLIQWESGSDVQIYIKQARIRQLTQLNYPPLRYLQSDADFKEKLEEQHDFGIQLLLDAITSEFGSIFIHSHSRSLLDVAFNSRKEFDGWRFIDHAAKRGDSLCLRILLLLSEWNLRHKNKDSTKTVLEIAVKEAEDDSLAAILDLPIKSTKTFYPLEKELINLLNLRNSAGNTPLMEAAERGNVRNVKLLIKAGADPHHKNALKENAIDIAWSKKHYACVQALVETDLPFPTQFNEMELQQNIPTERKLKKIVEGREQFHNYIKAGDLINIKKIISSRTRQLKIFYNKKNQSALSTAINAKKYEIYAFLQSIGFCSDGYKQTEQQLPINEKLMLKEAKKIYFTSPEAYHIIEILCHTDLESENSMERFLEIKKIYEKIDAIPEESTMLKAVAQASFLKITFDFNSKNVLNFEPTAPLETIGIYRYADNRIYVAADVDLDFLSGIAAHEMTHFIMQVIYSNECRPYGKLDTGERELEKVMHECKFKIEQLEQKYNINMQNKIFLGTTKEDLDPIITYIFIGYQPEHWPAELAARVPQMLAYYGEKVGKQKLLEQVPSLLNYYKNKIERVLEDYNSNPIRARYYQTKYKIQNINYQLGVVEEIEKLELHLVNNFFQSNFQLNPDGQDLMIIETEVTIFARLFLYEKMKLNKDFFYIFANLKNFKSSMLLDNIMGELEACPTAHLIVDCESFSDDNKIEDLLDAIKNFKYRERIIVIILSDNADVIKEKISLVYPNFNFKKEKKYTLADFTIESKKKLFETKKIILQEENNLKSLNDLGISFDDNCFKIDDYFAEQVIAKFASEEIIEFGSHISYLSDALALGRFRTYSPINIDLLIRALNDNNSADIFAFVSNDKQEINQLISSQIPAESIKKFSEGEYTFSSVRILLLNPNKKKEQFKLLCRIIEDYAFENKKKLIFKKPTLFLLEKGSEANNKKKWYLTQLYQHDYVSRTFVNQGDSTNPLVNDNRKQAVLPKHKIFTIIDDNGMGFSEPSSDVFIIDNNGNGFLEPISQIILLSGEVHEGKSMTLMHLSKLIKFKNKNLFVWVIDLLEHESKLKNIEESNESNVMSFLLSIDKKLNGILQRAIFGYQMQQLRKVYFFFDGFSELKINNKKCALNLFNFLINKTNAGVWVTSRTGKCKNELEKNFGVSGYEFNELEKSQKINFLIQLWTASLKFQYDSALLGSMQTYVAMIIERLPSNAKVINDLLLIRMFAETYHKKMIKEVISNSWSVSDRHNDNFNIGAFLEKFILSRFEINYHRTNKVNKKFLQQLLDASLQNSAILQLAPPGVSYKAVNEDEISLESADTLTRSTFTQNAFEYHLSKNSMLEAASSAASDEEISAMGLAVTLELYPFSQSILEYYIAKNIVLELCNAKIKARTLFSVSDWFFEQFLQNDRFIKHFSTLNTRGIRKLVSDILINNFSDESTQDNVFLEKLISTDIDIFSSDFAPKLDTILREDLFGVFKYLVKASKLNNDNKKFNKFSKSENSILHDIALYGNVEILEFIFKENLINKELINFGVYRSLINTMDSQYFGYDPSRPEVEDSLYPEPAKTPLLLSVQSDNIYVFNILLRHQAYLNVVSADGFNFFHFIAMFNHENFLKKFIHDIENNSFEKIALWERQRHKKNVERFIKDIASYRLELKKLVNAKTTLSYSARTPIMIAAVKSGKEVINTFMKLGAKPHALDTNGFTPLMIAAKNGNVAAVKALLSNEIVVEKINYLQYTNNRACQFFSTCGFSALLWAVKGGYNDIVELLLANSADIEAKDKNGNTALLLAVRHGYPHVVKTLILSGANTKIKNNQGENWVHLSVEADDIEILNIILSHADNIKDMLVSTNQFGDNSLHLAAKYGKKKIANKLLAEAERVLVTADLFIAYLEIKNEKKQTPLDLAIKHKYEDKIISEIVLSVEKLYSREKSQAVNKYLEQIIVKTKAGTLLHLAALAGNKEVTSKLLKKKNVDIEATNKLGYTALLVAAEHGHYAVTKTLILKKANIKAKNNSGETALLLATKFGFHDVINLLLSARANMEDVDEFGNTALMIAVQRRFIDIVKKFLVHGSNFEAVNKVGDTPLLLAIEEGSYKIVNTLLSIGAKTDVKNNLENTPLLLAVKSGNPDIVKIVLLYGADIKDKNNRGDTALHLAVKYGNLRVTKLLLHYGINIEVKNNGGYTALDLAEKSKKYEIIKLLKSKLDREDYELSFGEKICSTPNFSFTRKKRNVIETECEINWEDIDQFNEEKENIREIDKIKINSNLFLVALNKPRITEKKRWQLLELAGNSFVSGESANQVAKLINYKKSLDHLHSLGEISNKLTSGLMMKDIAEDFVNGNYKDVAINIGIIAWPGIVAAGEKVASPGLESGLQLAKQFISPKALKLSSEVCVTLSKSLKVSSSFIGRATSAFIAYDLINKIKAYKNGNDSSDALIDIVGDSIYLGVDTATVGIETSEILGIFTGVSSVTGPIGDVIIVTVFSAIEINSAAKKVSKLDQKIHLTSMEKFIEGLRAIVGMEPESYLENLLEEQQVNNNLVNAGLNYLTLNPNIQRYIFPTAKPIQYDCNPECQYKLVADMDNKVLLDYKRKDIKWHRSKPSTMLNQVFCVPKGDEEEIPNDGAYFCEQAIGVSSPVNRAENITFIALGAGKDTLIGFPESSHIVWVGEGEKYFTLGKGNDSFILAGEQITGSLDGGGGINTLDVNLFVNASRRTLSLFMDLGRLQYPLQDGTYNFLNLNHIHQIFLRNGTQDIMRTNCDTHYVDMRGGENEDQPDILTIPITDAKLNQTCDYDLTAVIRSETCVENKSNSGNFTYIIPDTNVGKARVDLLGNRNAHHHFRVNFNNFSNMHYLYRFKRDYYTAKFGFVKHLENTEFSSMNINNTKHTSDNIFKLTVNSQSSENITYTLADGTEIKLTEKNAYALKLTDRPLEDFIQDYPKIASRLKMSIFIESSHNETMAIGHIKHDVLYNDPNRRSHLIGNGGENIFVITSGHNRLDWNKLPIPEVIIHDVYDESSIDTLDLSKIKKQLEQDLGVEFYVKNRWSADDLIMELCDSRAAKIAVIVVLKEAKLNRWSERLHILLEHAPMKLDNLELKPVPLKFTGEEKYIVISQFDVEKNTQLILSKVSLGDYKFARSENNLVITNSFDRNIIHTNRISLLLIEFYKMNVQPLLISLSIKFYDKEIILRDEIEKINNATTLNDELKAYNVFINKSQDDGAEQINGCYDFVANNATVPQNVSMQNSNLEDLSSESFSSSNHVNKNINIFSNEMPEQTKYIVSVLPEIINDENNSLPMQCLKNAKLKKEINKIPNNEKISGNFRNASIAVNDRNVLKLADEMKPNEKIFDIDSKNSNHYLTYFTYSVDSWINQAIAWVNYSLPNSSFLSEGIFLNKIASNGEGSNKPVFPLANREAPRTVELARCKFGAQKGQHLAKGITCYSENMKIMLFIKNSSNELENPTLPFLKQDCQLITFNGRPSIYCENEYISNVYQPEILGNYIEQLNSNIMLLQVALYECKKMCSWAKNLFVQEKTVPSSFSEIYLITANQKKQWKEIIEDIEKNLTELDPEKFELRWIWHILEDRKEEFDILVKKLHSNIEEVNFFTENLEELQVEIEMHADLFPTTHGDIYTAQKVENTQNKNYFKGYFSWLTQGFFQEKICVSNSFIPEASNNACLPIGQK